MKHLLYKVVGGIYVVLALPSTVFFVLGALPFLNTLYTLALGGLPLGIIFILFGRGRFTINRVSNLALKFGLTALAGNLPLFVCYVFAHAGYRLATALELSLVVMIAFLSSAAFILLILALLRGHHHNHSRFMKGHHTA